MYMQYNGVAIVHMKRTEIIICQLEKPSNSSKVLLADGIGVNLSGPHLSRLGPWAQT